MRYTIAIIATVFAVSAANAQMTKVEVTGDSAFCLKTGTKADCKFETAAACQKMLKEGQTTGSETGSCVPRTEAK